MSVKYRLTEYIQHRGINKSEFCRTINVSSAFISSMVRSIQPDKLERIALNYPDLDIQWLLTGEGSMIKRSSYPARDENQGLNLEEGLSVRTFDPQQPTTESRSVVIPRDAWDIIMNQSESLKTKDRQMDMMIEMLKNQMDSESEE